jgi:hypothetical protein
MTSIIQSISAEQKGDDFSMTVIMYDGSQIECESIEVLGDRVIIDGKEVISTICIQRIIAKK